MPGRSSKPWSNWAPFFVFLLLIIGIFVGFQLSKYLDYKRPITTVIERHDRVEEIIDLINERYVDSVNKNELYTDAISGILKHLDPHTSYFPANDMRRVNEGLEGNFKGIGVEFFIIRDTILVTSIIKNGPAEDAGLKVGDKIIKVDTHLVAGNGIDNEKIVKLLRGMEDSRVRLTLMKQGNKLKVVSVKRGLVPLYSIDAAYMIDKKTGYIRINRFSATTYREFIKALKSLIRKGMTQLILDMRQNPGGYLDAATAIADELIGNDKLLVYTEGRAMPRQEIFAEKKGNFENGRLVVLVDEGSASASEILAGAVQDWDRGVVIGRQTFGKGLVQEQYSLSDGSALRLTVARYFTPTGRNIQRPYETDRSYLSVLDGTALDSLGASQPSEFYTEQSHRLVHGGGGINPDVIVPLESKVYSTALFDVILSKSMNVAVYDYFMRHRSDFDGYKNVDDFLRRFVLKDELMQEIKSQFADEFPGHVRDIWSNPEAVDYLRGRIRALFAKMLFNDNGYYQTINQNDKVVKQALKVINTIEYSRIINGKGG